MRPTRDQINSQLVSEKAASRSFVIKDSSMAENLRRANYEEKKRTLVDMFRSVRSQIQSSTQLTSQVYTTFAWAETGTRTIKQLRLRNIGNRATNITIELDDPLLVKDMFLSINR